jgi:Arc/MetJ-type ribon-helix-helix transcriptional regulator
MGKAISVRLDEEALDALRRLEATGLSRSESIRTALIECASLRRRRSAVRAEAKALEADPADRAEMRAVAALMEELRAPG